MINLAQYQVDAFGNSPSTHQMPASATLAERILAFSMPITESGCWIWLRSLTPKGYGQLTFRKKHMEAHRASWEAFNGPIPPGMHILHKCNNTMCVNPAHFYLGGNLENCADRIAAGTHVAPPRHVGCDHPMALLTEDKIREIRASPRRHGSGRRLARQYGVSPATISAVRTGRIWAEVA